MRFASRRDAGLRLGLHLRNLKLELDLVLGLPRGGVVVAAEVSRVLHRPLDVLVVRKIGHPLHREFAVGAMAEYGVVILDERTVGPSAAVRAKVDAIIHDEEAQLERNRTKFHLSQNDLSRRSVLLVDDGLATGATTEAAVISAQRQGAAAVYVAAPVGSLEAVDRLERRASGVYVLFADPGFDAVGRYYDCFPQTSDDEVLNLLNADPSHN